MRVASRADVGSLIGLLRVELMSFIPRCFSQSPGWRHRVIPADLEIGAAVVCSIDWLSRLPASRSFYGSTKGQSDCSHLLSSKSCTPLRWVFLVFTYWVGALCTRRTPACLWVPDMFLKMAPVLRKSPVLYVKWCILNASDHDGRSIFLLILFCHKCESFGK